LWGVLRGVGGRFVGWASGWVGQVDMVIAVDWVRGREALVGRWSFGVAGLLVGGLFAQFLRVR